MMLLAQFASFNFRGNPWLQILYWLLGIVIAIACAFWAAQRFGASKAWVYIGMCLGAIAFAAGWHFVTFPLGAAVGAVAGCVAGILFGR